MNILQKAKSFRFLLPLVLALTLLVGCVPSEPAVTYNVRFVVKGNVCDVQMVEQGQCPKTPNAVVEGLQFVAWLDENGNTVDPTTIAVTKDLRYEAVAYPKLTKHTPYLLADGQNFLRPDEVLSADELVQALEALAEPGARDYFPGLPIGNRNIDRDTLVYVLENFFPADQVNQAFPQADTQGITRSEFAQGMNALLGRADQETFTLADGAQIPMDITEGRADAAALLEASMAHTPADSGSQWADMELRAGYDPGFVNIDGWLYYVKEDGHFLREGKQGLLYFGADGRYTSGDPELDEMVANILKPILEENAGADEMTVLKAVFDHCHMEYKYLRKEAYAFGQTGWEIEDAKEMFESGRGNCYNFAAIFWALSRGMGYDTYALSGTCTDTNQPHGWCLIEMDGEDYFFDPEWQFAYRNENRPAKDMFKIPMDKIWFWTYKWQDPR